MQFFISNIKWVMLISGILTCTMFLALISPQSSMQSNFGEVVDHPVAEIITRNWGGLIGLIGVMLIYGAFVPSVRKFALVIAGLSKLIFILLILTLGKAYMDFGVGTAVIADSVMIVFFALYLLLDRPAKTD